MWQATLKMWQATLKMWQATLKMWQAIYILILRLSRQRRDCQGLAVSDPAEAGAAPLSPSDCACRFRRDKWL